MIEFEDNSWHFLIDTLDGEYKADLRHTPYGYPLWYGREKPSYLTQHSVTYGYNWAGDTEGDIWINNKKIHVKGTGRQSEGTVQWKRSVIHPVMAPVSEHFAKRALYR